jgi:hypothetical protein
VSKVRFPRYVRDLLADERNQAWRFERHTGSTHLRLRHVSGRVVVAANSPSDGRAVKNLLAQMRRVEREEAL